MSELEDNRKEIDPELRINLKPHDMSWDSFAQALKFQEEVMEADRIRLEIEAKAHKLAVSWQLDKLELKLADCRLKEMVDTFQEIFTRPCGK